MVIINAKTWVTKKSDLVRDKSFQLDNECGMVRLAQ